MVGEVAVQPVVRLAVTSARLREWVALLQQTLARVDEIATPRGQE
jgi:hypothetical protein